MMKRHSYLPKTEMKQ